MSALSGRPFSVTLLPIFLLFCACSDGPSADDDDTGGRLDGQWGLEVPGTTCMVAFTATAARKYEGDKICPLEGGGYGVEAELGVYQITGSELAMVPTEASCSTSDHARETATFKVNGDTLTLTYPEGTVVMEELPEAPGGSAILSYGCMDLDTGVFTPDELKPL